MSLNNNKRCTTPVTRHASAGSCTRPVGGFRMPSVPSITLTVQNENNPAFWANEDFNLLITEDGQLILLDNL